MRCPPLFGILFVAACAPNAEEPPAAPEASRGAFVGAAPAPRADLEHCPYPAQAARENVDWGEAVFQLEFDARGHVAQVDVLSETGHGFGEAARACAAGSSWSPLRDDAGTMTKKVRVQFDRRR